ETGNRLTGNLDLVSFAKREHEEGHECTEESESGHPPDVPDQGKSGNHSKESVDEARRSILRHFDRLVLARLRRLTMRYARERLIGPVSIPACDSRHKCKVPGGRRRCR